MVSVQDFLKAFSQQWNADLQENCKARQDAYRDGKEWTDYMLGEKKADFPGRFFDRLAEKLHQQTIAQRQNLDVVYYTTKVQNICHKRRIRPACFNVIIEHENGEEVEEEMWKLLMLRAPLKVLVFYDRPPWCKTATGRENWLKDKLRKLDALRQEVNREWPEADKTTYLFLVGRPLEASGLPLWSPFSCDSSEERTRRLKPMKLKIVKSRQDSFGESYSPGN